MELPLQESLQITEIYPSIQGESLYSGYPCVFIRLTGCPLRCKWCDTAYGFYGGKEMSQNEIISEIKKTGINLVELTGGEPLSQNGTAALIDRLFQENFEVLIETSGSEPIKALNPKTHIIMDLKCPDSKMEDKNLWENLNWLKATDEVKFVLASEEDYKWAQSIILTHSLDEKVKVCFSPAFGLLKPADLSAWMIRDRKNIRLNLQLHKFIWHPRAKGV